MGRGHSGSSPAALAGASRAGRCAGRRARRTAAAFPLARRAAPGSRSSGSGAHRARVVAPHGRTHTRLLPPRGCAGPPLLALPRRPLRAGRHPTMVRTRGVRMSTTSPRRRGSTAGEAPESGTACRRRVNDAPFAEVAAATNFSFLCGASHPHEMVGQAAELGLAAIGIADNNTLAGVVRAHEAAKEHKIRCLTGARLVTTEGFEAVCYPTDRAAYGRLCHLLTTGNRRAIK